MDIFWKVIGATLITVILALNLCSREKDMAIVLTMITCCLGAAAALSFLKPLLELLTQLEREVELGNGMVNTLLKCTGVAIVAELTDLICKDAGFDAMGKVIQLLGHSVILNMSIPLITSLLAVLRGII